MNPAAKALWNFEEFVATYEGRHSPFDPSIFNERDWTQNIPRAVLDLISYFLNNIRPHGAYNRVDTRLIIETNVKTITRYLSDQLAQIAFKAFKEELVLPTDGVLIDFAVSGSLVRYVLIPVMSHSLEVENV